MIDVLAPIILLLAVVGLVVVVAFLRERGLRRGGRKLLDELEQWRRSHK